jgi:hypothetical protein
MRFRLNRWGVMDSKFFFQKTVDAPLITYYGSAPTNRERRVSSCFINED